MSNQYLSEVLSHEQLDAMKLFIKSNRDQFDIFHPDLISEDEDMILNTFLGGIINFDNIQSSLRINKLYIHEKAPKSFIDFVENELGVKITLNE